LPNLGHVNACPPIPLACYEVVAEQFRQLKEGRDASTRETVEPFLCNPSQGCREV